ncbi:MAG: hypothetical protein ACOVNV_08275, partial [Pirellulaceae bacterium]
DPADHRPLIVKFEPLAQRFSMRWQLRDPKQRKRVMLLASTTDHCLASLQKAIETWIAVGGNEGL